MEVMKHILTSGNVIAGQSGGPTAVEEAGNYVTDEFIHYAEPLIQDEISPLMVDGLPGHLTMPLQG